MGSARALVALLVLISVAGCASATPVQSPTASGSASPTSPSNTSYDSLFSQVGPDGSVSKDVALQAFSTAIAPLPGVPAAPGGAPNDEERMDGTFAIDWLRPYMDQLTPDQLAVVNAALAPDPSSPVTTPEPVAKGGLDIQLAAFTQGDLTYYADQARLDYAARLHRSLAVDWSVTVNATNIRANDMDAWAYTDYAHETLGGWMCLIHVNPSLYDNTDHVLVQVVMAHEMFHCFQDDLIIRLGHPNTWVPTWIIEGGANWAAEAVAGPTPYGSVGWGDYLAHPEYSLWMESYNAIGFYQHMAEKGIDPWGHFDAMITAFLSASDPSFANSDAYKATGVNTDDNFLDTWASGMSRIGWLPSTWHVQGPWATDAHAPVPLQEIHNGDLVTASAPAVTNADSIVDSKADITELSFEGHVRMDTDHVDTPEITTVDLCTNTTADGCTCPEGSYFDGPPLQASDGIIYLGITGSLDGSTGTIRGRPLSDFCTPNPAGGNGGNPAPRGGANPCANGCAGSVGDPHFETVDHPAEFYDFQAAGEYTLLRSPDGSMEMQGRQVPLPEGDVLNVSTNKALAWKVAGHRIGMYVYPGVDTYALMLDGKQLDLTSVGTMDLGSGAALTVMTDGIEVAYGDGTIATVFFDGIGLNLEVAPSDTFRSQAVGLLAHVAAGSELPALPDGTALPRSTDDATRYSQRYKQLGPAWQVTDQTTLFDYQSGETTATFYKPDYPSSDAPIDPDVDAIKLLQGAQTFDQSAQQCAGVQNDQTAYQHCIFDTLLTGDPQFAAFYAILEQFLTAGPTVLETPVVQSSPTPAPSTSGSLPAGFALLASGVALIDGATVGPDGTVYASLSDSKDYSPLLVSLNTSTGQPATTVQPSGAGELFLLDGSLWMAENDPTGSGKCLLERFDPQTLASQVKIPVVCDIGGVQAVPVADGVWWLDRSTEDANAMGGMIRHIDPATNMVDRSIELPFTNGYLSSSSTTVVFGDSDPERGWYRLLPGATSFVQLPVPDQTSGLQAVGEGVWFQPEDFNTGALPEADFVTASATPDTVISIGDSNLAAADEHAIYVDSPGSNPDTLMRLPTDGSAPSAILSGATLTTSNGSDDLGFFDNNPLVVANQRIAKVWLASDYPVGGTTSVVAEVASVP